MKLYAAMPWKYGVHMRQPLPYKPPPQKKERKKGKQKKNSRASEQRFCTLLGKYLVSFSRLIVSAPAGMGVSLK